MIDKDTERRLREDHDELKERCRGLSLEETLAELEEAGVRFDLKASVDRVRELALTFDVPLRMHVQSLSLEENVRELAEAGVDFEPAREAARVRSLIAMVRAEWSAAEALRKARRASEERAESGPASADVRVALAERLLALADAAAESRTPESVALRDALQDLSASLARPLPRSAELRRTVAEAQDAARSAGDLPSDLLASIGEALEEAAGIAQAAAASVNYAYLFRNLEQNADRYDREEDAAAMEEDARTLQTAEEQAKIEDDEAE